MLLDTHIQCFFLCAEIYATSHIIILIKAFPTHLPYQDIENRTYLYVLYEYLSTLGKKSYIYACAESRRLPNESRFNDTSLALTLFDSLE